MMTGIKKPGTDSKHVKNGGDKALEISKELKKVEQKRKNQKKMKRR
jgi:hypothetical protein